MQPRNDSCPRLLGRRPSWTSHPLFPVVCCAAAGFVALPIDAPLARWFLSGQCPDELERLFSLAEVFSHGFGVLMIAATIFVLDPAHRWSLPRILAASLGSGMAANAFKLLAARVRPYEFDLREPITRSFQEWLPLLEDSDFQAFPSSHTATAVGLAIVLSRLYPRGHWWFCTLAALASVQRISSGAHFLSDVLWGSAVGLLCCQLDMPGWRMNQWFDRFEAHFGTPRQRLARLRLHTEAEVEAEDSEVEMPQAA